MDEAADPLQALMDRIRRSTQRHAVELCCLSEEIHTIDLLTQSLAESQRDISMHNRNYSGLEAPSSDVQEGDLLDVLSAVRGDLEDALEADGSSSEISRASEASTERRKECISEGGKPVEAERDKIAALEASEASLRNTVATLERNVAQLTMTIKQLTKDKAALKQETQDYEEKLQSKDDLIAYLEGQICNLQGELREVSYQMGTQCSEAEPHHSSRASYPGSKVRKSIKGGKKSFDVPDDEAQRIFRLHSGPLPSSDPK